MTFTHEVEITLPTLGHGGKVVVDGEDVSHGIRGVRLESFASDVTVVELHVIPKEVRAIGAAHLVPMFDFDEPDAELRSRVELAMTGLDAILGWLDAPALEIAGEPVAISKEHLARRLRDEVLGFLEPVREKLEAGKEAT